MSHLGRLLAALLLTLPAVALAHEGSTSYLSLESKPDLVEGRIDIALVDLALTLPLDGDGDGRLTWNETRQSHALIAALVGDELVLTRGGASCETVIGESWLTDRLGLVYLSLDVVSRCPGDGPLGLAMSLFFDRDDSHRVLVSIKTSSSTQLTTLSPGTRSWSEPDVASNWRTALDFVWQGMWHVWIGYDHLLFLLLLMLPAVLTRENQSGSRVRAVALDLVRIVTAFTVAHSITLGLAATLVLRLPQGPIEVAIAVSIVVAALINLWPGLLRYRLPLAFGFGLVHGFGFANALAGLGTRDVATLPVLAGFNIGVELANLAVIALALPLLLLAGRFAWYEARALRVLSLAAAGIGVAWIVQRI